MLKNENTQKGQCSFCLQSSEIMSLFRCKEAVELCIYVYGVLYFVLYDMLCCFFLLDDVFIFHTLEIMKALSILR